MRYVTAEFVDGCAAAAAGRGDLVAQIRFSLPCGVDIAAQFGNVIVALGECAALFAEPVGNQPPPLWIRGILVLTCTLVSFFHGSNDGQKGMGLIMLILIGTVPTAYALNHAVTYKDSQDFIAVSAQAADALTKYVSPSATVGDLVETIVRSRQFREIRGRDTVVAEAL